MIPKAKYQGMKPPAHIVSALRKHHPMVHLMWAPQIKRWCLIQVYPRPSKLLTIIAKHHPDRDHEYAHPNLDNTVRWLYEASPANKHNKWALDRWLQDVEDKVEAAGEAEAASAIDRVHEAHERLWHAHQNKTVVQQRKTNGSRSQRSPAV